MEEISLIEGLFLVEAEHIKLKSDGLEPNEYIEYVKGKGICYEDGAFLGEDAYEAFSLLNSLAWTHSHKFYTEIIKEVAESKEL